MSLKLLSLKAKDGFSTKPLLDFVEDIKSWTALNVLSTDGKKTGYRVLTKWPL